MGDSQDSLSYPATSTPARGGSETPMCMIPLDSYQEIEEHEILLASSHLETAEVSDTPLPDISGDGEDGNSEEEDNPPPQ